jgi:hypothetical protein
MYTGSGLADARPITGAVGGGLVAAGGMIAYASPLIGGIVAGVGALTQLIGSLFKPDLTKIAATQIVDQIEAQVLKPVLQQWMSAPPEQKTAQAQAAALSMVDQALAGVRQGCSNPALGEAGQRCISERLVKGGTAPWCPTSTGCDWITLYRDPIANDPQVSADPLSSLFGGAGSDSMLPLLLIGGLLALAVAS